MLMQTAIMKRIISLEYLFAAVFVAIFFVTVGGFDWWWLLVLFIVFDVSMVGYLMSNHMGALTYNIGHSIIGPTLLASIYIVTNNQILLFITLLWLFHIFVDRALGYGMKHTKGFDHTHLGKIGKASKKKV
jgi:hypothetical protein